jgi:mannose-6-phosphate isomerase-like protein (cupin superfamily)
MRMQFREGNVDVNPGELITVPKGLEHCPMAVTDHCTVVLFEPAETINTGNFDDENYIHESSKEGLSLHKTELKDV